MRLGPYDGISALVRGVRDIRVHSPHYMRTQQRAAVYKPERGGSLTAESQPSER